MTVSGSTGCDTLWFGSGTATSSSQGFLGTISTTSPYALATTFPISFADAGTNMVGSAAVAIDPQRPNLVYYIPRDQSGSVYGGLWVYNAADASNVRVATSTVTPDVNRLSTAPDGSVWAIANDGRAWRWTSATGWTDMGSVTLPNGYTFNINGTSPLGSGDLVFDGLGTMWLIGSNMSTQEAFLYTISYSDLTNQDGSISASLVGSMGSGEFNGLAFTSDGTLWATTRSATSDSGSLFKVNKESGSATLIRTFSTTRTEDLASCALPKPELKVTKEVSPTGAVFPGGTLTYTIKITNIGTLSSTNTTLQDTVPAGTTYVAGSAKLNTVQVNTSSSFPYTTARLVNSPGENPGIIAPQDSATVTFQVKVNTGITDTNVCNQGLVSFVGASATGVKSDDPNLPGGLDPTCTIVYSPKINLVKTGSERILTSVPQTISYTYTVTNPGTEALKNVKVIDDKCAPAGGTPGVTPLTYVSGDIDGDSLLAVTETWIFTCVATLNEATVNTAIATGVGTTSGQTVSDTDTWSVTLPPMTIDKTSSATAPVAPGDTITYTVVVGNSSQVDQTNVTLTDVLPVGVTYVAGSAVKTYPVTQTTGGVQTGTFTKELTTTTAVDPDAFNSSSYSLSYTVTSADIPAGATLISVSASTTGNTTDWLSELGGRVTYPGGTAFSANEVGSFGPPYSGSWSISKPAKNLGGTALGTYSWVFTDSVPTSGTTNKILSAAVTITYTYDSTVNTRTYVTAPAKAPSAMVIGSDAITLKPGETLTVTFRVTVDANAPSTLTNSANTTSTQMTTPITDSVTDTVVKPAITVVKTVAPSPILSPPPTDHEITVKAGTGVYYYYAVSIPPGFTEPLRTVTLTDDKLGTISNLVSGDTNGDGVLQVGETWLYLSSLVTMSVGGSTDTSVINVATATGFGITSNIQVTDTDTDTVYVIVPVFDVRKSPGLVSAPAADGTYTATYSVHVKNVGTSTNTYGPITDTVSYDPNIHPLTATWSVGTAIGPVTTFTSAPHIFTIGSGGMSLAAGAEDAYTVTITFSYAGTSPASLCAGPGTGLYNSVTLPSGQEPTVNQGNNSACMPPPPSFAVTKTPQGGSAGGTGAGVTVGVDGIVSVSYAVSVTNTGLVSGQHLAITDTVTLPSGFILSSVSVDGAVQSDSPAYTIPASITTLAPGASSTYTVVVTAKASDLIAVDWTKAATCTTTAGGTPADGGFFNLVGMLHDTDGPDNNDACVPVTPPTVTMILKKLAENCDVGIPTCPLPHASFDLYAVDPTTAGATPIVGGLTVDSSGAVFTSVPLIVTGTYWIVESQAPTGFALMPVPIGVTVTSGGLTLVNPTAVGGLVSVGTAPDTLTLNVINTPAGELPKAGGNGSWPFLLLGVLLVAVGGRLLLNRPSGRRAPS